MRGRTVTAIVSGVCLIVLIIIIAVIPVPFVCWSPGAPQNALGDSQGVPLVSVDSNTAPGQGGQLLMVPVTTTGPASQVTFPAALLAYLFAHHAAVPRAWVYPAGMTSGEIIQSRNDALSAAQQNATVSALRTAGIEVDQNPVVESVSTSGPAYQLLLVGDVIETVNGTSVQTPAEVDEIIAGLSVGEPVTFTIVRKAVTMNITVTTQASASSRYSPRVGVTLDQGYRYTPQVRFNVKTDEQDASAGLMLALAVYQRTTHQDITGGKIVAGTGTIESAGAIGVTSGIEEKMYVAAQHGATDFLVPSSNCSEVRRVTTRMKIIRVNKLDDAVSSLNALRDDPSAAVPSC
ncbi:PDZ domain-containing protein [Propionibacterium sp.]|uniref:YlbL family protein n=1 Tax=Propionibacterium sp. TaxID=1977903 RepID=UPI0039EB89B9